MSQGAVIEFLLAGVTDTSGEPLALGKVYTYFAGTTTDKDTYTTQNLATVGANPIVLDSVGCALRYASGNYKLVVKDANDVTIHTYDNVFFGLPSGVGDELTNIADGTALTSAVTVEQVRNDSINFVTTVGGSANAITLTNSIAEDAYATGQRYRFAAASTNTGATTVNVDSLGVKNIKKYLHSSLINLDAGDIFTPAIYEIVYDGTQFILLGTQNITAVSYSDVTVSNSVTETTMFSVGLLANALGTDRVYRMKGYGTFINDTGADETFTWKLKLGSTTIVSRDLTRVKDAAARDWHVDVVLQANGATNSQKGFMTIGMGDKSTALIPYDELVVSGYGTAAEDGTTVLTLSVSVTLSTAAANSSVTCKGKFAEAL